MISIYLGNSIPLPETIFGDHDYDTHSTSKRRLFGKISEDALHVMKDNTKAIVIAMNEGEARENVRYHETIDCEEAQHLMTLELED